MTMTQAHGVADAIVLAQLALLPVVGRLFDVQHKGAHPGPLAVDESSTNDGRTDWR